MKLLVTGGAGFIGSNFIHFWLARYPQDQIINLDKLTYAGNLDNLSDLEHNPYYHFVQGDICDANLVNDLVSQVDIIVHFAAESHVDRSIENATDFIRTNVEGTRVLLDAAKNTGGKRFHHISTDEVFGALKSFDPPFTETTPYDPRSPYSASKAASDHLVRAYFYTHKLPITISNCSNNYGPYQFPEKLIPLFITNLIEGKKVPVYGRGENIRDWIHVEDHCRGVEAVIQKGIIGQTYLLGGQSEMTNMQITESILQIMNQSTEMIDYVTDRPGHDFRYAIDFSKARQELNWEPEVNIQKGLAQTVAWYQNNSQWWRKIKSDPNVTNKVNTNITNDTNSVGVEHVQPSVNDNSNHSTYLESSFVSLESVKNMKGIILSGGRATRLRPCTKVTSKQLLPVYNRPMIYYPLNTLIKAGIKEVLIIVAPESAGDYLNLLGSGKQFGIKLTYEVQDEPRGLAEAFIIGENFIDEDNVALILGDNIFEDDLSAEIQSFTSGAKIFGKEVPDPERFGVAEVDTRGRVVSIEEKPKIPKSNLAIVGLYIYDNRVVEVAKHVKPSARGELEITDLHNWYLERNEITLSRIQGEYVDAGTFDSLLKAQNLAKEKLQGSFVI